ncbi:MAG TPA: response regulator [Caldilinea sp.]|nr:response regulator [Caldilinea sp.]
MNTLRLLIIDDDEDDFLLTSDLLNQVAGQPVHATWAESYEAALAYIRRDDHDICLVDYRLGAHDGLELIKTAVALGCRAPMILMTGQGDHSIDLLAMQAGAVDYLVKGEVDAAMLERSLRYALERSHIMQALIAAKATAEQANKAKSQFLANMSHEIRTPLNAILGSAELVQAACTDPEVREYLQIIQSSGAMLLNVINEILDFSKIESSEVHLERLPTVLDDLLENLAGIFQTLARGKSLTLTWSRDGAVPAQIYSDPTRLRQILTNLLSNAAKFTSEGSVTITIALDEEKPRRLRFSVADTGIGIASASQAGLFQPFHQVDASTTRRFGGTGLGLAICKRLVEALNGTIWVESEPGHGTTFHFTLPYEPVVENTALGAKPTYTATDSTNEQATASSPDVEPLAILLAEDNIVNQKVTIAILRRIGYRCDVAENGAAVLEMVRQRRYDLVLMDLHMPVMDGYEATRHLLSAEAATERPIVVALTAAAMAEDRDRCRAAGMDDFLAKPVGQKELLDVITRWRETIEARRHEPVRSWSL